MLGKIWHEALTYDQIVGIHNNAQFYYNLTNFVS